MEVTKKVPEWDLSEYYSSLDDENIDKDLADLLKKTQKFAVKYKGKISTMDADTFVKMLKELEKFENMEGKLAAFSSLSSSADMTNVKASALNQKVMEKLNEAGKDLIFVSLEYNKLSDEQEQKLFEDKRVQAYKPFLKRIRKYKKYELPEDIEQTLMEKSLTSGSAWVRLYEESHARFVYELNGKKYSEPEISKMCLSPDAEVRKAAGIEINRVSKENSFLITYIYNMIMKDQAIDDEKRGFKQPMSSQNLSEEVADEVVDSLADTVRDNYKNIAWRYYALKAKLLGVEKIGYWDRNAPLPFDVSKEYTWDETVKLVLSAYKEFSPKLYNLAKDFFENDWIDAAVRKGKRSGAFCSGPLVEEHPFLLMSFAGKRNDVLTLAHELGHGCHHQLRRKNGVLNETCRFTSEEIASVFAEMLTFQKMLRGAQSDKEKICLLSMKINDMINTAIRQISFHFFEKQAHDERKNGELSTERLNEIWLKVMRESLGPSVVLDENSAYIWEQIGHFFFRPFYVYAYSFADCAVNSLYWLKMQNKVDGFEDKYLDLLSKTAIGDYNEIFAPFGLNPGTKEFWQGGLNLIDYYLTMLEELVNKQ